MACCATPALIHRPCILRMLSVMRHTWPAAQRLPWLTGLVYCACSVHNYEHTDILNMWTCDTDWYFPTNSIPDLSSERTADDKDNKCKEYDKILAMSPKEGSTSRRTDGLTDWQSVVTRLALDQPQLTAVWTVIANLCQQRWASQWKDSNFYENGVMEFT
jgi:hypothetical protein